MLVQQLPSLPSLWWGLWLMPLAMLAWYRTAWLTVLFFVAGVVWISFRAGLILNDTLPRELEGQDLIVDGCVADIPKQAEFGQRFEFDVTAATLETNSVRLPRKILLNSRVPQFSPRAGECWRLRVRLNRPHAYQNPGGFDYEAYLFYHRLRAKGYVREATPPQLLTASAPWYAIDRLRQNLGERIRAQLPDTAYAGMIVALANGDSRGVTPEQWQTLRRTGTSHLVAISGLHISLVGGIVFFLGRWLWALPGVTVLRLPAPMFGAIAGLLAAAAYAALAGFVVPTQRALIMLAVVMSGVLLRRRIQPSMLLAIALLLVLIHDPLAVMAAGFWLSFAAVAVIVFAISDKATEQSLFHKWGYLQWAIALGMLPLTLSLFQQASLVAPIANMLAVPVFDLMAVPLTLMGVLAMNVMPDIVAHLCFQSAAWLLQTLWWVLDHLARLPWSLWSQHQPPIWTVVCACIGIAWLLMPRGTPARFAGSAWLLPMVLVAPPAPAVGEVWFTLLDVGQGLSAVVRTSSHTLVFDTGPRFGAAFDTGEAVVLPYLHAVGVRRVDTLIISHGDNDHIGGAASILNTLPVTEILSSVPERLPTARLCQVGQRWRWDEVEFTLLNPLDTSFTHANNASCVLQVRSRYGSILLPADIEAKAEKALVARWGKSLRADILVAPHHGSKTSSTENFIDAVAPRYVLFPVGYRNHYRHPNAQVAQRYAERGIFALDSPASGAIELSLRASGFAMESYRRRRPRYWYSSDETETTR